MLSDIFLNTTLQRGVVIHIEPALRGHEIRLSTTDGSTLELIISDEAIKTLFMQLMSYPRIGRCVDEALRRNYKKLKAFETRQLRKK